MRSCAFIVLLAAACTRDIEVAGVVETQAEIFPDYRGVTIPANIAPLNFEVLDVTYGKWVLKIEAGDEEHMISADGRVFSFGKRFWKRLLSENQGRTLTFTLYARGEGGWLSYAPFTINVAPEDIDPYLVYRKIPPGYSLWQEMGIYQRCLEDYDERAIYRNVQGKGNCVNCHSFRERDPDDMLFHMRSEFAGTYIFTDGRKEKLDTKTDSTMSALVYPHWHESGRYVAFSVNRTNQVLHVRNSNRIEVFDEDSDVVVYDIASHEIVTTPFLKSDDSFETFPAFSPDGKSLYYCSAKAVGPMPERFKDVRYSLCRVDFNPSDCSFADKADTLYNAVTSGGSVSFPRISPDGRFLVFTLSGYGNFSIWHKDADLYCIDLRSGKMTDVSALNSDDVESYHSWSGNGRWIVFSSRRDDGLYTRPYIGYVDADGRAHKPFMLPQKDPKAFYDALMYSYNIPEFVEGKVSLTGSEAASFARNGSAEKVKYVLR